MQVSQNLDEIHISQRTFYLTHKTKNYHFRLQALNQLKEAIKNHEAKIFEALKLDLGKSEFEAYAAEIGFMLEEIGYVCDHLAEWMRPKKVSTPLVHQPASSQIHYQPYGQVLIIAPWNYPFQLALSPLVGAIAAGNTAIIKPSEFTPNVSRVINEILGQIYPPEFIYVALGDESVAKDLLELKFDKIFFTGSTRVGKIIAQKAAMHLTPVTLELGGKSPCIVTDAINLEVTAKRIMWGKFLNAGQTCVAPDYCLVNETIAPAFIDQCKEVIKDFFSDNPSLSQDYGRIVSATHFERLVGLMQGGEVIFGGKSDRDQKFIEPTLIVNPKLDHDLMQEEIFGPLLPIITYKHTDEVFEFISTRESPLALYLFTRDENFKNRVVNEISFGGGCINDTIIHLANPNLPFGGVGASGLGSYHGHKTFLEFSHQKSILEKSIWPDVNIRYAPYKDKTKFLRFFFN